MALTNHEYVGKAMVLLQRGLGPFVESKIVDAHPDLEPSLAAQNYEMSLVKLADTPIPE